MCPNERAIQSRIKEAFGVKINAQLWEVSLESLSQINEQQILTNYTHEDAMVQLVSLKGIKDARFESNYIFDFSFNGLSRHIDYQVNPIEKYLENETNQKVLHLYISGETYIGQDQ